MDEEKSLNRRRKSIMVIDKKGQAKELAKEDKSVSTLIDTTDKTKKDRIISPKQEESTIKNESLIKKEEEFKKEVSNIMNDGSMHDERSLHNESIIEDIVNESIHNEGSKLKEEALAANDQSVHSVEKKTLNMRNAEIAAGASAGTAGIILGKSKSENDSKHVSIDEKQNEEHEVLADANREIPLTEEEKSDIKAKSPFIPQRIPSHNLSEDSEIKLERDNNNVEAEGHMWKRRRIFACFWHEKYFVLTKDGILKYHKANGTKKSKGNWKLSKFSRIHEVFMGGEAHPFRLALMNEEENLLFGFDDSDNREYWLTKLSKFIN